MAVVKYIYTDFKQGHGGTGAWSKTFKVEGQIPLDITQTVIKKTAITISISDAPQLNYGDIIGLYCSTQLAYEPVWEWFDYYGDTACLGDTNHVFKIALFRWDELYYPNYKSRGLVSKEVSTNVFLQLKNGNFNRPLWIMGTWPCGIGIDLVWDTPNKKTTVCLLVEYEDTYSKWWTIPDEVQIGIPYKATFKKSDPLLSHCAYVMPAYYDKSIDTHGLISWIMGVTNETDSSVLFTIPESWNNYIVEYKRVHGMLPALQYFLYSFDKNGMLKQKWNGTQWLSYDVGYSQSCHAKTVTQTRIRWKCLNPTQKITTQDDRIATATPTVRMLCRNRDQYWQGIYQKYSYIVPDQYDSTDLFEYLKVKIPTVKTKAVLLKKAFVSLPLALLFLNKYLDLKMFPDSIDIDKFKVNNKKPVVPSGKYFMRSDYDTMWVFTLNNPLYIGDTITYDTTQTMLTVNRTTENGNKILENVTVKTFRFDSVFYHKENIFNSNYAFLDGLISTSNGSDITVWNSKNIPTVTDVGKTWTWSGQYCRTKGFMRVYQNTVYSVSINQIDKDNNLSKKLMNEFNYWVHFYDENKNWLACIVHYANDTDCYEDKYVVPYLACYVRLSFECNYRQFTDVKLVIKNNPDATLIVTDSSYTELKPTDILNKDTSVYDGTISITDGWDCAVVELSKVSLDNIRNAYHHIRHNGSDPYHSLSDVANCQVCQNTNLFQWTSSGQWIKTGLIKIKQNGSFLFENDLAIKMKKNDGTFYLMKGYHYVVLFYSDNAYVGYYDHQANTLSEDFVFYKLWLLKIGATQIRITMYMDIARFKLQLPIPPSTAGLFINIHACGISKLNTLKPAILENNTGSYLIYGYEQLNTLEISDIYDLNLLLVILIDGLSYYELKPVVPSGVCKGILPMMANFDYYADWTYDICYNNLKNAQKKVDLFEQNMASVIGDVYRLGGWYDDSYVDGDEGRLYVDALDNLKQIAKPLITYDITFLDLYGYQFDSTRYEEVQWPDIDMSYAVHLIDPAIDINTWAYFDKILKCYDKPWQTKISVNTNLTTMAQHSFTDVMTTIALVASSTKAKDSITNYKISQAVTQSDTGTVDGSRINDGTIDSLKISLKSILHSHLSDNIILNNNIADGSLSVSKIYDIDTKVNQVIDKYIKDNGTNLGSVGSLTIVSMLRIADNAAVSWNKIRGIGNMNLFYSSLMSSQNVLRKIYCPSLAVSQDNIINISYSLKQVDIYIDSVNGNDSEENNGSQQYPYKTLLYAFRNCGANDTVNIYMKSQTSGETVPYEYDAKVNLVSDININFFVWNELHTDGNVIFKTSNYLITSSNKQPTVFTHCNISVNGTFDNNIIWAGTGLVFNSCNITTNCCVFQQQCDFVNSKVNSHMTTYQELNADRTYLLFKSFNKTTIVNLNMCTMILDNHSFNTNSFNSKHRILLFINSNIIVTGNIYLYQDQVSNDIVPYDVHMFHSLNSTLLLGNIMNDGTLYSVYYNGIDLRLNPSHFSEAIGQYLKTIVYSTNYSYHISKAVFDAFSKAINYTNIKNIVTIYNPANRYRHSFIGTQRIYIGDSNKVDINWLLNKNVIVKTSGTKQLVMLDRNEEYNFTWQQFGSKVINSVRLLVDNNGFATINASILDVESSTIIIADDSTNSDMFSARLLYILII